MNIDFPFHIDARGRTAATSYEEHVRDMIEEVLFTTPGERVNRPTFGCGLLQLVFAPNSNELAAATQYIVQGSLQQWLGDVIQVNSVTIESQGFNLRINIGYTLRAHSKRKAHSSNDRYSYMGTQYRCSK
jgi:phage baseplate assembly protein W